MSAFLKSRSAVANVIFAAAVVILIVLVAIGFGLYGMAAAGSKILTSTNTVTVTSPIMTETTMMTAGGENNMSSSSSSNNGATFVMMFTPKSGTMISQALFLSAPTGTMGEYALSIHAEGLEPNGTYLVEATPIQGGMVAGPISAHSTTMNTTQASEFQANGNGTGNYWIVLDANPLATFESVQLAFLPGMSMENASVVASLSFASMTSESTAMATTSSG